MSAPLWPDLIEQFQPWISDIRGKLVPNQMLSELTWFRVGGPATRIGIPARNLGIWYAYSDLDALLQITGYAVAMEILIGTPLVADYIRTGEVHKLKDVMKESTLLGMKTFDQSLFELYQAGEISYESALRFADSSNEVRLRIKLAQGGDASTLSQGMDGVEISENR